MVPRRERERQMLQAAAQLFTQRGYDGVSMDEIAKRVGVTKPMLSGLLAFLEFVDEHRDEWSIFFVGASGRGG